MEGTKALSTRRVDDSSEGMMNSTEFDYKERNFKIDTETNN